MINRLCVYDGDGCLLATPLPEEGKRAWEQAKGVKYPYIGWWSKPESLDLNIFNIKAYPKVLMQLNKDVATPDTYVIILTSRMKKLQSEFQAVLDANNIHVDKLDMKYDGRSKGQKVLDYIKQLPELEEVNVYDDRNIEIESYYGIINKIPDGIIFNIYLADNGDFKLIKSNNKLNSIVSEEIEKFVHNGDYIYHGTNDGATYYIQRDGRMRINAANNNEPFISFTSKPNVAKYYAKMKGGSNRAVILRTKLTDDFELSPKFLKNDGFEWITTKEIPTDVLEINTVEGWIPLNNWDIIDKKIKN